MRRRCYGTLHAVAGVAGLIGSLLAVIPSAAGLIIGTWWSEWTLFEWSVGILIVAAGLLGIAWFTPDCKCRKCPGEKKSEEPGHPSIKDLFTEAFFQPYTECPKCGKERLHWMTEAKGLLTTARECIGKFNAANKELEEQWGGYLRSPSAFHEGMKARLYRAVMVPDKFDLYVGILKSLFDVVRTCRECGHEWGQKIGVPTE